MKDGELTQSKNTLQCSYKLFVHALVAQWIERLTSNQESYLTTGPTKQISFFVFRGSRLFVCSPAKANNIQLLNYNGDVSPRRWDDSNELVLQHQFIFV